MKHPTRTRLLTALGLLACAWTARAQDVIQVNKANTKQTIWGFGAAAEHTVQLFKRNLSPADQTKLLDKLFRTDNDNAGLSIIRLEVNAFKAGEKDPTNTQRYTFEPADGVWDWDTDQVQRWFAQEAINRNPSAKFLCSPWSPPSWMKTNGSVINGGNLKGEVYDKFANYLKTYVDHYRTVYGFDIRWVSIQNEPSNNTPYGSCTYSNGALDVVTGKVADAIHSLNQNVLVGSPEGATRGISAGFMGGMSAATKSKMDFIITHDYGGAGNQLSGYGKPVINTEVWAEGGNDSSIGDGIRWANAIKDALNRNEPGWLFWWIFDPYNDGAQGLVRLTGAGFNIHKRLFTMGQFSRFMRYGDTRVEVTSSNTQLGVVASKDALGKASIVVINGSANAITTVVHGLSSQIVQAYRTSATESLAQLSDVNVYQGQATVVFPPKSVTTLTESAPPCNKPPTIDPIPGVTMDVSDGPKTIALSGISDGDNCLQGVNITSVVSSNPAVVTVGATTYASCDSLGSVVITPAGPGSATVTVTLTDGGATDCAPATTSASFAVNVAQTTVLPAKIEAEDFANMSGVIVEPCTDTGLGEDVGYVDTSDWMTYLVKVPQTGTYAVNFRVAGWKDTGVIALQDANNVTLASATVPNTGNYQVWETVAGNHSFTLAAGTQTLRIFASAAPWNLNWFEITGVVPPAPPVISSATTATGQVGVQFTYQIAASNNPTSFSATGLPAGLTVNASGLISGTPAAAAVSTIALGATNASGTGSAVLTLTVNPQGVPAITSSGIASGLMGAAFTYQITATNNPTSFSATGLPAGLTVNAVGLISGTPTAAGVSTITLGATNAGGTGIATLTLTVTTGPVFAIDAGGPAVGSFIADAYFVGGTAANHPNAVSIAGVINPAPLAVYQNERWGNSTYTFPGLSAGAAYSVRLHFAETWFTGTAGQGAAGVGLRQFNVSINGTPVLTNFDITATAGGANKAIVKAFDTTATSAGKIIVQFAAGLKSNAKIDGIEIIPSGPPQAPVITSATTASGQIGTAFTYQIAATNSPTSFGATGLPLGLSMNATGLISGTPTVVGASNVYLTATNAGGMGVATLVLTINGQPVPVITSATTAGGLAGSAFTYQITATNAPTSFSATGLPVGLSVNTAGLIAGTLSAPGVSTITLGATNAGGTGSATLTLTVTSGPIFAIDAGGPAAGSFVADANFVGGTAAKHPNAVSTAGVINPAPLAVYQSERWGNSTYTLPGLSAGTPYLVRLHFAETWFTGAAGQGKAGAGLRQFNVSINGSQVLTNFDVYAAAGGANKAIVKEFNVAATSAGQIVVQFAAGLKDNALINGLEVIASGPLPAPVITSAMNASGQVGIAFSYQIKAANFPTSFSATGLPTGLNVNATGLISGTPVVAGTSAVNLSATNGTGTGTAILSLSVTIGPPPVITSALSTTAILNMPFTYQITATSTPTSYNASGLPTGLTINTATGLISGTPTVLGTSSVTLSAANTAATGTAILSLAVSDAAPYVDFLSPPLGTGNDIPGKLYGVPDPTQYKVLILVTANKVVWYDKTHIQPDGFMYKDEVKAVPINPDGSFLIHYWAGNPGTINPGDLNNPHIAVIVVPLSFYTGWYKPDKSPGYQVEGINLPNYIRDAAFVWALKDRKNNLVPYDLKKHI